MKVLKKIMLFLLFVLIVLQFFPPKKNNEEVVSKNHIAMSVDMPKKVSGILQKACFDCHSNHSQYPWYSSIAPVSYWMAGHIKNGKKKLNFSEWKTYSLKRQEHKIEEIIEEVEENKMPLKSYTFTHKDAVLTQKEKEILYTWFKSILP